VQECESGRRSLKGRPRAFTVLPTPPFTPPERRRLRRWLQSVVADEPLAAERLSIERGVLRVRTADRHRAEALAELAGAAIGRRPFVYALAHEADPERRRER
jgi:hypothetical protein